jgi:hypothetical protein
MEQFRKRSIAILVLALFLLSACNYPGQATPTQSGVGQLYTAAAQTVAAQLTEVGRPPVTPSGQTPVPPEGATVTTPPLVIPSDTSVPPTTVLPSATSIPPSPTPIPCDRAKFVKDVTVPDNTNMDPGEEFVKTWRLQNDGSCTWTTGYALVFTGGDSMETPAAVPLTSSVPPGQAVDLSITLTAPDTSGTYRGNYKLRNASNVVFGLGDQNKAFWVQIDVAAATGLLYDFLVKASGADWTSGTGSNPGSDLAFDGADDNSEGAAKIKDGVKLENGATSGKILLTFPKHDNNGFVSGVYPAYTVQSGDHFRARLGFMIPGGGSNTCGSGKVIFQVSYEEGGDVHLLKDWEKTCNGNLLPVDIDLSGLKGTSVKVVLTVKADGSFQDDWAIWNSPRIEH